MDVGKRLKRGPRDALGPAAEKEASAMADNVPKVVEAERFVLRDGGGRIRPPAEGPGALRRDR